MALTDIQIKNAKNPEKKIKLTDGAGMYLLLHPNGSEYWRMQYRFDGKQETYAIGVYPSVSLSEARIKRDEARAMLNPSEKNRL